MNKRKHLPTVLSAIAILTGCTVAMPVGISPTDLGSRAQGVPVASPSPAIPAQPSGSSLAGELEAPATQTPQALDSPMSPPVLGPTHTLAPTPSPTATPTTPVTSMAIASVTATQDAGRYADLSWTTAAPQGVFEFEIRDVESGAVVWSEKAEATAPFSYRADLLGKSMADKRYVAAVRRTGLDAWVKSPPFKWTVPLKYPTNIRTVASYTDPATGNAVVKFDWNDLAGAVGYEALLYPTNDAGTEWTGKNFIATEVSQADVPAPTPGGEGYLYLRAWKYDVDGVRVTGQVITLDAHW